MTRILVAEDSVTQALDIRMMLEGAGYQVEVYANGRLALEAIRRSPPQAVLTDLHMPEMDGLELVESVRDEFPKLPVILMTAYGSEEIAVEALLRGAASYVPKKILHQDLLPSLANILSVAQSESEERRALECLTEATTRYTLENDPLQALPVVAHFQETLALIGAAGEADRVRAGVALEEAIQNAIFHGNLELTSRELRERYSLEDGGRSYYEFLTERRQLEPFRQRRVYVEARVSKSEISCSVRDDGPGFDFRHLKRIDDPQRLSEEASRGLVLISSFMDDVRFNDRGNEIMMSKRCQR